jgi:glycosyltransferase involved in cell wall biosynthesis
MIKYSVIIPLYNEEKSILSTVNSVKKIMKNYSYELILVNDASKDRSASILSKLQGVNVINHPVNKGYGGSLKSGMRAAQGEWIIIADADATYPIEDIPKLISYTTKYDMVVGARTGRKVEVPLLRRPAKWMLKIVARAVTGINIPDLNSGLRVFKKEMAMRFWNLYPQGFSFTTTLTIASLANNYAVKYVPINYFKREGKSSINPIKDFIGFNMLIFKVALYFAPLKFFTPTSVVLFLIGIIKAIMDFVSGGRIGIFAAIVMLFSVQIFFFGLLADLVNKRTP